LEPFKEHSYPDLLLSVLIATFEAFAHWLDSAAITAANKTSFWQRLFGRAPKKPAYKKVECSALAKTIRKEVDSLKLQLHSSDASDFKVKVSKSSEEAGSGEVSVVAKMQPITAKGGLSASLSNKQVLESEEQFKRSKIDFLRRWREPGSWTGLKYSSAFVFLFLLGLKGD
jgi:hypothetical protein